MSGDAEITCISLLPVGWRWERPPSASQLLHDAHGIAIGLRWEYVDDVTTHAVVTLCEFKLVSGVLHLRESAQDAALVNAISTHEVQHHAEVGFGIAKPVDR